MKHILSLLLCSVLLPTLVLAGDAVNLNTADAATLARELKGIGETRAQAIVEHRSQHGPFRTVDELTLVKGIGQKVVEQNRAILRVDRAARPATAAASVPAPAGASKVAPAAATRAAPARPATGR